MLNTTITGDNNVVTVKYPSQQQLNLETKETFGTRIEPSIVQIIKARADARGTTASRYAGSIIKKYLKLEPHLKDLQVMIEDIVE